MMPRSEVFWSRVEKTDSCWLWRGAKINRTNKPAYGTFGANRRYYYAHRYSYEDQIGPIAKGLCVCHRCDTPLCVRPDHLFLGTHLENVQDMINKKRVAKGAKVHQTKLSAEDIPVIRASKGKETIAAVAQRYSLSRGTISAIWYGRTWKHVA